MAGPDDKLDDAGLSQIDYVKAAFKWQYNWIALLGAATFALVSHDTLPLVLAAGLELMYIAMAPQSARFRRLVRSWKWAAEKKVLERRLNQMYRELPPEMRSRYANLDFVCKAIRVNYSRLSSTSQIFSKQIEDKLGGLMQGYVRLLHAANTQRDYLQQTNSEEIRRELTQLQKSLDKSTPKVQEINRKRIEILGKRLEKYEKILENRQVIDAQCAASEDVLALIRDQSVTMRDPQQVSDQLDSLVQDVEQTEQNVREVEEIFALTTPDTPDELQLPNLSEPPRSPNPRARVRN
jgi:hypothetical protein